jgi:hypothetical protein
MTAAGRNDPCPCGSGRKFMDMESHSERERRAGRVAYDFAWMWAEPGLDRPE